MGFPNPAFANEEHIVMSRQEGSLRELEQPDFGDAGHQRKVKVLQALLVRKRGGFEPLAQLLLMALRQFAFEQALQVAQIA